MDQSPINDLNPFQEILNRLDKKMDQHRKNFNNLQKEVNHLKINVTKLEAEQTILDKQMETLEKHLDNIEGTKKTFLQPASDFKWFKLLIIPALASIVTVAVALLIQFLPIQ